MLFRFALGEGILPLTGSSDPRHLALDLQSRSLKLSQEDVETLYAIEG